jgi:hypothetical protein
MHQLELLGGAVGGLTREGPALQLGHHIGVTELLDMVNVGHAVDHLHLAELLQGLKVKMPKALMPAPCLLISARGKAKWVRHLHMKHKGGCFPSSPW